MSIGTKFQQEEPVRGFGFSPFGDSDKIDKEFRRGFGDQTTKFKNIESNKGTVYTGYTAD